MNDAMKFKKYLIPKQLESLVDYIYVNEHDKEDDVNIALPNMRMCFAFTFKHNNTLFEKNLVTNEVERSHELALGGFMTQSIKYFTKEKFRAVIVGLNPLAKYLLKDLNGEFYLNENIELEAVYPKLLGDLKSRLNDDGSDDEKVALVMEFLKKIFTPRDINPSIIKAVDLIKETRGTIKIDALSKEVAYSKRQLNRLFKLQVGISPKEFSQVHAVQNCITMLKKEKMSMVDVAVDGGYFDQTHFIKTFKKYCGVTPENFKKTLPSELSNLAHKKLELAEGCIYM